MLIHLYNRHKANSENFFCYGNTFARKTGEGERR
ncbi:hypothetical protein I656_03455 [Geobacillus sp. WSUCF1]|nr:hypothetical protein I656_03455 [Geobacillus sp. WSUCF1]